MLAWKHVRAFFVEQERPVPLLHRIVVHLECLVAFVDFSHHQRAVHDRLERADRGSLVQREHVDRLDRRRFLVSVAVRNDDFRVEAADVGLDRDAGERHRRVFLSVLNNPAPWSPLP